MLQPLFTAPLTVNKRLNATRAANSDSLNLSGFGIRSDQSTKIARFIRSLPALTEVDISENNLESHGIRAIAFILEVREPSTVLHCEG